MPPGARTEDARRQPGRLPLDGVRVLAVENFIAGPVASMWLADAGAEVVKIERPDGGDQARSVPPLKVHDGLPHSMSFLRANRNKKSVTLDLKHPDGQAAFLDLALEADIVLENLRPGSMQKLGLGYDSLAARSGRLIYVSVTGFGQDDVLDSPLSSRGAFDITAQALSGLMNRPQRTDPSPVYLGFPLADLYGATLAVASTYQALFVRERTGLGGHVDIALFDGAMFLNELAIVLHQVLGMPPASGIHGLAAPFGSYRTRDGWVAIAVLGEATWKRFVQATAIPELAASKELNDEAVRPVRRDLLEAILQPWLDAHDTHEVISILESQGVPVSECLDVDDVVSLEQTAARAMLVSIDDPVWGQMRLAANPMKSTHQWRTPDAPPPALGANNDEVLRGWLGWSDDRIAALRQGGALGG